MSNTIATLFVHQISFASSIHLSNRWELRRRQIASYPASRSNDHSVVIIIVIIIIGQASQHKHILPDLTFMAQTNQPTSKPFLWCDKIFHDMSFRNWVRKFVRLNHPIYSITSFSLFLSFLPLFAMLKCKRKYYHALRTDLNSTKRCTIYIILLYSCCQFILQFVHLFC